MRDLVPGIILLRIALIAGLYVILIVAATINPMPVALRPYHDVIDALSELAFTIALIAPVVAILGALILRFGHRRRFKPVDWISLVVGVSTVLLPALFIFAYSNCPNGIC